MRKLVVLSVLAVLLIAPVLRAQQDEFAMGNKFYESKDYPSAIRMYESVLKQGVESAPLYFNLGNAYFKNGDLGEAILNYMRARRLDPGDEDIQSNLEFARQYSRVQMEGVELNPVTGLLNSLLSPYHVDLLAWVASGCFVILMLILILRFGFGFTGSVVRGSIVTMLTLTVIAAALTTYKYRSEYLVRRGVILAEESPVYTGASENSDIELQGAPGLVVRILDESDGFYNVQFANKRRGWIKSDLVAEI